MPESHTSSSFGSSERPLRRYISLLTTLDRVLVTAPRSGIYGQLLRERLVRGWAYYVHSALHLEGIAVSYSERGRAVGILEYGAPGDALRGSVLKMMESPDGPAFRDFGKRLFVERPLPEVSARFVGGLLHRRKWSVREIGWIGDAIDLLQYFIATSRTRELDRIALRVTDRQTMLKELRPNSLYYNLLGAIEHAIRHDYSSTLVTCVADSGVIAAETLHHLRPARSARIGMRVAMDCRGLASSVVGAGTNSERDEELFRSIFGEAWGSLVRSALLLNLRHIHEQSDLIVILSDSRPEYFSLSDLDDVEYIAGRTTPIIVNSVQFSSRIEARSRTLDELILRSVSTEEMLNKAVAWLRETFDAAAASIHLSQSFHGTDRPMDRGLPADLIEKLHWSGRALYHRATDSLGSTARSWFVTSLRLLDGEPGIVACQYDKVRQPTQFEHYLLETAAQQISAAVAVRTVGDTQLAELRRVVALMEKVAGAETEEQLLNLLTSEVKTILGADYCFISLPGRDGRVLWLRARTWGNEFDVPPIGITGGEGEGITGHVAKEKIVYRTGDVANDEYYRPIIEGEAPIEIRSEMAGALVFEGQLIGVIDLLSSRGDAFSEQAETLLRMLLAHSSIALAQTQRRRVAREHADVVERLHAGLLALDNPEKIYKVILDTACDYVSLLHPGHEVFGNLYVKRPSLRFLQVKAFRGAPSAKFSPVQYFDEGVVGRVANTRKSLIIRNTSAPPENIVYEPFIEGIQGGSEIAVPICVADELDAVINLESPQPALFGIDDQTALEALAQEISLAVRFAQLHETAQIHNRSAALNEQIQFVHEVSHQVAKAARFTSQVVPEIEPLLERHPKAKRLIKQLRERAETALRLEQRLIKWRSRPQDQMEVQQDVIACVKEAVANLRQYPDIDVTCRLETESFQIVGSHDLVLVFMNLFDNAVDAMEARGKLTIREHVLSDRSMLVIDVTDTGHGVRSEVRERIWEPFFSDDGTGKAKGQGMGMALIRDNLEGLGAFIELLDSELQKGTTFRLTFTSQADA